MRALTALSVFPGECFLSLSFLFAPTRLSTKDKAVREEKRSRLIFLSLSLCVCLCVLHTSSLSLYRAFCECACEEFFFFLKSKKLHFLKGRNTNKRERALVSSDPYLLLRRRRRVTFCAVGRSFTCIVAFRFEKLSRWTKTTKKMTGRRGWW